MPNRSITGRRVFIAGLGHHDYEPAKQYGDLFVVISGNVDLSDFDGMYDKIKEAMILSEPGDYVLLSGAPIICLLCVLHMLRKHETCNVLQWDGVLRDYTAHTLEKP